MSRGVHDEIPVNHQDRCVRGIFSAKPMSRENAGGMEIAPHNRRLRGDISIPTLEDTLKRAPSERGQMAPVTERTHSPVSAHQFNRFGRQNSSFFIDCYS